MGNTIKKYIGYTLALVAGFSLGFWLGKKMK